MERFEYMLNLKDKEKCSGCGACSSACPQGCISMEADSEGFLYPHVDSEKCISCGKCLKTCPIINPIAIASQPPQAFAAYNLNNDVRESSSSGGLFTLFAEEVLKDRGSVYGAAFTEDCRAVRHIRVDNTEDLKYLRGSKYLQSIIGSSYIQAKADLENGKPVLFTGTPCQIGGLRAYLGKDYPHLYTQDIICHGVPSPKVWTKYVDYRENEAASKTRRTFFRHKKYGWKMYSVQFEFSNCTEYIQILRKDLYMRGFLADLYLRPSCHHCAYKGINRTADITLADFWGINRLMPEMDDDKGTSLVLVHSEKGRRLFEAVQNEMNYRSVSADSAVAFNSAATTSVKQHPKREYFFLNLDKESFPKLISDCLYEFPCIRVKNLIKRVLRKIKRTLNIGRTT